MPFCSQTSLSTSKLFCNMQLLNSLTLLHLFWSDKKRYLWNGQKRRCEKPSLPRDSSKSRSVAGETPKDQIRWYRYAFHRLLTVQKFQNTRDSLRRKHLGPGECGKSERSPSHGCNSLRHPHENCGRFGSTGSYFCHRL